MSAQHKGVDILHRHRQLLGNEGPEPCRIQNASHADHPIPGKAGDSIGRLHHGIQRVADHDQDALGGVLDHLLGDPLDDFIVLHQEVVSAHSRLSGKAGGNDDDVRVGRVAIVIGSHHARVESFHGSRLLQIQGLPLGYAIDDVDKNHIRQFLVHDPMSGGGADISRTHNRHFSSHRHRSSRICSGAPAGTTPLLPGPGCS